MMDKLDLLDLLTDKWTPTNTMAKRAGGNWHTTFGLLCILYKQGYIDLQEVQMSGKMKSMLWRKKQ